jgi:hypothetical protein
MVVYPLDFPILDWRALLIFGGGALIGAGVMTPFKRPKTGALVGFVLTGAVIVVWIIGVVIWFFIYPPHIT